MFKAAPPFMALLFAGAGVLAAASVAAAQGDGSETNNPDLLRGSVAARCAPGMLCHFSAQGASQPAPAAPVVLDAPVSDPAPVASRSSPAPAFHVSDPVPQDYTPAWDTDLSLALRGSYVSSGGRQRYEAHAIPRLGLSYAGRRAQIAFGGEVTLVQPQSGETRLGAAVLDGSAAYLLGTRTGLEFGGSLELGQDDPDALSQESDAVAVAPVEWTGAIDAVLAHRFGRFDAAVSGGLSRTETTETKLAGGGSIDNSVDDATRIEGGLRLGYALTPIAGVFVSGTAGRDAFDKFSPELGASRSGWVYDLRGGIELNWRDVATLEASAGSAWRRFDDPNVTEAQSLVYGAALGFNPDTATALRASFDTALSPGSGASAASVDYTLALEASYRINTWVTLRGSGSASWNAPEDGSPATRRYTAGAGADFSLGDRTAMSFDYDYGWRDDPSAATPERDEHRASAGVTLQY